MADILKNKERGDTLECSSSPMPAGILSSFAEREKTILHEAEKQARSIVKKEIALFEFELFSKSLPEKEFKKADESIRRLRDVNWKNVLKQANGDTKKAIKIYDVS